jgi:hypothetical protein
MFLCCDNPRSSSTKRLLRILNWGDSAPISTSTPLMCGIQDSRLSSPSVVRRASSHNHILKWQGAGRGRLGNCHRDRVSNTQRLPSGCLLGCGLRALLRGILCVWRRPWEAGLRNLGERGGHHSAWQRRAQLSGSRLPAVGACCGSNLVQFLYPVAGRWEHGAQRSG